MAGRTNGQVEIKKTRDDPLGQVIKNKRYFHLKICLFYWIFKVGKDGRIMCVKIMITSDRD